MRLLRLLFWMAVSVSVCRGEVFTWSGAANNGQFSNPANWVGGAVPPSDGTATLVFTDQGAGTVRLPVVFSANQIQFQNTPATAYNFSGIGYTPLLTVQNGFTMSAQGGNDRIAPGVIVSFLGNQLVDVKSGSLELGGTILAAGTLTKLGDGNLKITGTNFFLGDVIQTAGTLTLTNSGNLGLGTLHLAGGNLAVSALSDVTIPNPISIEANTTLSGYDGKYVFLAGNVTLNSSVALRSAGTSVYFLAGQVGESGGSRQLSVSGLTPIVLSGTSSYTGGTVINNGALVFGTAASIPTTGKIESNSSGYAGIAFTSGVQSALLSRVSATQFHGTIGFDSAPSQNTPTVFNENLNLTGLTQITGLGSYTSARLTGEIKVGSGEDYRFGGGGGTLYVESGLSSTGHDLQVNSPSGQPLTVVLRGANTFTGSANVSKSVLVLDSAQAVPTGHTLNLTGPGYIGYTEQLNITPNGFLGRFGSISSAEGIVGIDSTDRNSPRTVSAAIDLSLGGTRNDPYYLGTSSKVTLTGDITPTTGNSLYLTAVKGGDLVVASNLGANVPALVVGQANSFDAQGGTVELRGHNTFTGGTHILGGTLLASASSAFGTGAVTVGNKATLSIASDVLISNPLSLSSGARLSGTGTLASPGGVAAVSGSILSPGGPIAVGTLTFETGLSLGSGGSLEFDIKNLNTGAGKGWDLINVSSGELSLSASAASPFTIFLTSLTPNGAPGILSPFDTSQTYSWQFITANSITGFSSNEFTVDTTAFTNNLGTGSFFVSQNGNSLAINFTPVPEPATYLLLALGLGLVAFLRRHSRQK